jgi:two-component system, NarL family, response regulator NreC
MYTGTRKFKLSVREQQVLDLICREQSSSQIAATLNISIGTVYTYRKNLLRKTGTSNSIGLLKYAMKAQMLKGQEEMAEALQVAI